MTPGELAAGIEAAGWITVAAMLVALAAAVLCTAAGYLAYRALGELRDIARAAAGQAAPADAPTETIPAAWPPVSLPLDARPVAPRVRPYLLPRGHHHHRGSE